MPNIRPLSSVSVQGYVLPIGGSVLLKPCAKSKSIRDGFLRAINVSDTAQTLRPSKTAQKQWPEFVPMIVGDNNHASLPMAWDNPSIRFEILSLPNSQLPGGDRELLELEKYTARGSTWTMKELVCAVPAPAGSPLPGPNNPKNYMGYDRTNWQVFVQDIQEGEIHDVDVIVGHGVHLESYSCTDNELAYIFETLSMKIAFVVSKGASTAYTPPNDSLRHFLDAIGTSGCISLLQKAIRRRPLRMQHPETTELFSTVEVVRRIARRCCCGYQQGFFLPNIGKFVSGLQHFLKRLFIIAAEDSIYDVKHMFDVSMCALLASLQPTWVCSPTDIERIVSITVGLLRASVTSHYDTSSPVAVAGEFQRAAPAAVQAEMGGMGGDQRMLRWLALHPNDCNRVGTMGLPLSGTDPLDIYCDQHQDGRLVCLLEPGGTFPQLLSAAFRAVSGFNTRRSPLSSRSVAQQMVFDGLRASSKMLRGIVPLMPTGDGPEIAYELNRGALAGMVGTMEMVYKRSKYFVTVSSRDIHKFVVIPKPSRDNKKGMGDITPETRDAILRQVKTMLSVGRRVGNSVEEAFRGKTVRLREDIWSIDGIPWSEAVHRTFKLVNEPDWTLLNASSASVPWTTTFAGRWSLECRQFVLGRMAGFDPLVLIPKMNRGGLGTDESLTGLENEAYQFMMYLSQHYPSALWPSRKRPYAFDTASVAFRRQLCEKLRATVVITCEWPPWHSHKQLRAPQVEALDEMMTSYQQGFATFLWMLVGQGKTLTVLRFLEETRSAKYVVWSMPKSAVSSVAIQIREVGWQPMQLYPSKGLLNKHAVDGLPATINHHLQSTVVYIIEHDHLRKLTTPLARQMGETAFIFDEVHKAMQSGTKRTAAALRLARIAKQLVALTGTPIVDKTGYGLMEWLRLCVPFPVRASNFWVAANSMVSQLNTGDVITEDVEIQAFESEEDKLFFRQRFPFRAPWHGQTTAPTRSQWLDMRNRTDEIVTNEMVRISALLVGRHPVDWRAEHLVACERDRVADDCWDRCSQRPLVVASCQGHVIQIVDKLLSAGIPPRDILCCGGARPGPLAAAVSHVKTIHLTEQAVLDGEEPPYKVVVAALRYCEGYSLTWMTCMVTGSYPSNQASRTQMRGRINRLDAQRLHKRYMTVLGGTTTITYRYQLAAKMMEDALKRSGKQSSKKQKKHLKY